MVFGGDVAPDIVQMDRMRILQHRAVFENRPRLAFPRRRDRRSRSGDVLVLVRDQGGPVESAPSIVQPKPARILELLGECAGIDEQLLGDAAAHHAGAAETIVFGDSHPRAICADTRAARTPPDPAPMTKRSKSNVS